AGAMLAVPLSVPETESLLAGETGLSLAAVNGPGLSVIAGPEAAATAFARRLAERGIACRRLRTSHAFHSPMMRPAAAELTRLAASLTLKAPRIPFISNVTGTWITDREATDPAYWAEHLCLPVRFASGLATLASGSERGDDDAQLLLEVGPGQTLGTLARQRPDRPAGETVIASLRDRHEEVSDQAFLLDALARLWVAGAAPDWAAFNRGERRRRMSLPTYPFERRRYFLEPGTASAGLAVTARTDGQRLALEDWFSTPYWESAPLAPHPRPLSHPLPPPGRGAPPPSHDPDFPLSRAVGGGWERGSGGEGSGGETRDWLLLGDGDGLADRLEERLILGGDTVQRVAHPKDYGALFSAGVPGRIVHLLSLDDGDPEENGFYSLLALARALADLSAESRTGLHVSVVTSGVAAVLGDEALVPERAALLGPSRVLPQEVPGVASTVIDVLETDLSTAKISGLADQLMAGGEGPLIALRGRRRFLRRFRSVTLPPAAHGAERLRQNGVYLITGGLDETGVTLAEQLFKACGARLCLVAPEDTPPMDRWGDWLSALDERSEESRRLRRVLALERSGCDLLVTAADLAHAGQVRQAVELATARFGALHGVVHAAGRTGAGLMQWKSHSQAASVLAPKMRGTRNLAAALADRPLDFFVLFGSNAAISGGFGQSDTAAGAVFLDVFAQAEEQTGRQIVQAIDWDFFRWQPITASTPELAAALEQGLAKNGIAAEELFEIFLRVLASSLPQVIVSTQGLDVLTSQLDSFSATALLDAIATPGAAGSHARPEISVAYESPQGEAEEVVARVWQEAFGIDRVGRDDNFFELSGNSLLAIQIVTRISQALGVDLPTASLLEAPTVAGLAAEVERLRPATPEQEMAEADPEELDRLLREIEALSLEEAEAKLARELETMS
ncbi:MAG TPA: KR domain-containing protein, partial [Thermoanaerobaculia bacterium]